MIIIPQNYKKNTYLIVMLGVRYEVLHFILHTLLFTGRQKRLDGKQERAGKLKKQKGAATGSGDTRAKQSVVDAACDRSWDDRTNTKEGITMKRSIIFCSCLFILASIIIADTANTQPLKPVPQPKVTFKKPIADLVVSNVKITPENPRAQKDMITIEVTVKNTGSGALPKVCSLAMDLINQDTKPDYHHQIIPWYTNNIPQLSPGAEVKISKTITIPYPGRYKLSMVIITEGLQVGDEKPGNNQHAVYFQAAVAPERSDLILDNVSLDQEGRVVLRMHNAGAGIPDQDFNTSYVRVKIDNTLQKSIYFKEIDPNGILKRGQGAPLGGSVPWGGTTTYLNFTWPNTGYNAIKLEPGHACIVEVILDYNSRISDKNGTNNKKTVTLTYNP